MATPAAVHSFFRFGSQKFHAAVLDVVHGSHYLHSFFLHFHNIQAMLNEIHAALHIQTAGFEIILLVSDGQLNLVGNKFDIAIRKFIPIDNMNNLSHFLFLSQKCFLC